MPNVSEKKIPTALHRPPSPCIRNQPMTFKIPASLCALHRPASKVLACMGVTELEPVGQTVYKKTQTPNIGRNLPIIKTFHLQSKNHIKKVSDFFSLILISPGHPKYNTFSPNFWSTSVPPKEKRKFLLQYNCPSESCKTNTTGKMLLAGSPPGRTVPGFSDALPNAARITVRWKWEVGGQRAGHPQLWSAVQRQWVGEGSAASGESLGLGLGWNGGLRVRGKPRDPPTWLCRKDKKG